MSRPAGTVSEVAGLFLRLGLTAFGGPAAHIAMMHDEVVVRRKWMDEQHFLDMIGATNLIPGPNSTEMAIHVSYARAGWRGLLVGGSLFILPAALMVGVLAWAYVQYGSTSQGQALLYGIQPVVIAVVAQALLNLGQKAVKGLWLAAVGVAVFLLYLVGFNELILLAAGAIVGAGVTVARRGAGGVALLMPLAGLARMAQQSVETPKSLEQIFLIFLKVGAVLYGSGYVLLAFLRNDLVTRLGWLTEQQLIDAVAIGQVTPGPVFTTATFVGYVLAGVPGAVVATVGIFLPSFCFVALLARVLPYLRKSIWTAALLDGVNASALGLMAGVTWQLGVAAIFNIPTALLALVSALLLFRYKVNTTWLILGGAVIGLGLRAVGW